MRSAASCTVLASAALLSACAGAAALGDRVTRIDSAGVAIVTSHDPAWREGEGWRIDPEPTVTIGPREDADPRYDLLRVRAGTVLPSGEIALLSAGHQELRIYSARGEWLRTFGRMGDGPGEFRGPGELVAAGDTLFVTDGMLGRLSAFSTADGFLTSWSYPVSDQTSRMSLTGRLASGAWLGTGAAQLDPMTDQLPTSGLIRGHQSLFKVPAGLTGDLEVITVLPGDERVIHTTTGPGGALSSVSVMTPVMGRSTTLGITGNEVVAGDNGVPELRILTTSGAVRAILRWPASPVPVTPALIDRMKAAHLAGIVDPRIRLGIEARFGALLGGTEVPYFQGFHVDATGAIWVREFPLGPSDPMRLQVFAADGAWLGQVVLPPHHTILEVGRSHLLTVWRDDDDLEHVRVYRLRR